MHRPCFQRIGAVVLAAGLAISMGDSAAQAGPGRPPTIINGSPAAGGEFPYAVSLRAGPAGAHFCGAVLIDPAWVLTAAHCAVNWPPTVNVYAVIGRTNLSATDGDVRLVTEVRLHPSYTTDSLKYDVALLKLQTPSTRTPIRLAFSSNRDLWDPGDNVQMIGWGATHPGGSSVAGLRSVTVPIVSDTTMVQLNSHFDPATMVGTGYVSSGAGACVGDSGGAVIASSAQGPRLVGTISGVMGNCGAYQVVANARVAEGAISRWIIGQIPTLANDGAISRSGDFNGDGRDDLVTFTRGSTCDVYVATSHLWGPFGPGAKWHDTFSCGEEVPLVGDFTGDGRSDIVTFTRGWSCDVYVATSTATAFVGSAVKWHDSFACLMAVPAVGDVNGDNKDDVVAFHRGASCDVYVAVSNGFSFGPAVKWHDLFGCGNEIPAVGDFNGDGRSDIATMTRGLTGDVFVAASTGSTFVGTGVKWHDLFSVLSNIPAVGDFNGDGRDDLVTFSRGQCGVYVIPSHGAGFGTETTWNSSFACGNEIPGVGDFNGDNKDDVVTFTRYAGCDVYVATSLGSSFGPGTKMLDVFACASEIPGGSTTW
jgi:hypothetical protein